MDHVEPTPETPAPAPASTSPPSSLAASPGGRGMVVGATAILSGFVLFSAPTLWTEWQGLRQDWEISRLGTPYGFVDISPNPSYAQPPDAWVYRDGDSVMLWSGWTPGVGHGWFRIGATDMDTSLLHQPLGRDVIRAIDEPIVEVGKGVHWGRMQPETPIVAFRVEGVDNVYPLLLLEKVEVINDQIKDRALLVVFTPFVAKEEAIDVFDPLVDGRRLTFGLSGHFQGAERRPFLYDRQTESLWSVTDGRLVCKAGHYKGVSLTRLSHQSPTTWGEWAPSHPDSRLVVGAVRPRGDKRPKPRPADDQT
jgi:hypothetical protein